MRQGSFAVSPCTSMATFQCARNQIRMTPCFFLSCDFVEKETRSSRECSGRDVGQLKNYKDVTRLRIHSIVTCHESQFPAVGIIQRYRVLQTGPARPSKNSADPGAKYGPARNGDFAWMVWRKFLNGPRLARLGSRADGPEPKTGPTPDWRQLSIIAQKGNPARY